MNAPNNPNRSSASSISPGGSSVFFFNPKKWGRLLFLIVIALELINLLSIYLDKILGLDNFATNALVYFFDVSKEGNVPALFSALILFITSMLLLVIGFLPNAHSKESNKKYWISLGLIFLFLTIDEAAQIHEQFNKIKSVTGDADGYLMYPWIIAYGVFALVIGLFFLRFLFKLPARTRTMFIISGAIYVGSALGFELIEGRIVKISEVGSLEDKLWCSLEEFLEMSGIVLFIYSLLNYIASYYQQIVIIPATRQQSSANLFIKTAQETETAR